MDPQQPRPDDDFDKDLHPEHLAGTNYGDRGPDTTQGTPASDVKDLYGRLPDLTHTELAEIPIVPEGTRLEQGKTYIDIDDLDRGEFKALASMRAESGNRYVAKDGVSYDLWNKLRGRGELTP